MEEQNQIDEQHLKDSERKNSQTSPTKNNEFDKNGYLVIRKLLNPKILYEEPSEHRGIFNFNGRKNLFSYAPIDGQVKGSLSRYHYPPYRGAHFDIKNFLENEIGEKLHPTYYFDRFYFPGLNLEKHLDRPSCEISVTLHISSNCDAPWPLWIKTPDTYSDEDKNEIISYGENHSIILYPGDAVVYKGCERPHWRESMPNCKKNNLINIFKKPKKQIYYHQAFFHYVLQNGERSHFAYDRHSI